MSKHSFLQFLLTKRAFAAVRNGTKQWLAECSCGSKRDLWEAGRVRYKAAGQPKELLRCPVCGRRTWQQIRKKTDEELQLIE